MKEKEVLFYFYLLDLTYDPKQQKASYMLAGPIYYIYYGIIYLFRFVYMYVSPTLSLFVLVFVSLDTSYRVLYKFDICDNFLIPN